MDFDLLILGGKVVDGSSNPWFHADIGVRGEKISEIGRLSGSVASKMIDASGKVVAPGFIDMHSHSDIYLFTNPLAEPKTRQGVTTEVLGQDGLSVAPLTTESRSELRKYLAGLLGDFPASWTWRSVGDYLKQVEEAKPSVNTATYVGHGSVRAAVMGFEERAPTPKELQEMKELVDRSMKEGAFGLSTGLIYPPSCYADVEELGELCKAVADLGGYYVTHLRNEADTLLESMKEAFEIARVSGVPAHISHHKAAGRRNWGRVRDSLAMIDRARDEGMDVTCDQYPYIAGSTMLSSILPSWAHEGGTERMLDRLGDRGVRSRMKADMERDLQSIMVTYCRHRKQFEGKMLTKIAEETGKDPYDAAFDLLLEEEAAVSMAVFNMCEDDVKMVMRHPAVMIGTDGLLAGRPHPRAYGTYPRILGRYVREERNLGLEDAVRKMTSLPAQRLGLRDRGLLREGYFADIAIFDPEAVLDRATFEDPLQFPAGVEWVIVNGAVTVENGAHTGARNGKVCLLYTSPSPRDRQKSRMPSSA